MAHKIKIHDEQWGIKQAWHALTKVRPLLTLDDNWLTQWEVCPVTLQKNGKDSKWAILECSDNQLEVGSPYNPETFKPIDNKAFIELVRQCISGTQHKIVSLGSVRNRGRVFLSIELAGMEKFKAAGREFSAFLNFGNGHDKSSVLWANTSNICTVCDNTFGFNLHKIEYGLTSAKDDVSVNQRHTKNALLKLPEIAKLIDKAIGVQAEFQLELDKLSQITVKEDVATNLFAGFIGRNIPESEVADGFSTRSRNMVSRLVDLHNSGLGNRGQTLADSFQAVTEYYTRESSKGKTDNLQKQFVSSEFGSGLEAKRSFWNIVTNDNKRNDAIEKGAKLLLA